MRRENVTRQLNRGGVSGLCVLAAVGLCAAVIGCGRGAEEDASFPAETSKAEILPIPQGLPEEVCDYREWTRESVWTKLADAEDGNAAIYANRDDREKLYLWWNGQFAALDCQNARQGEWGVRMWPQDLDMDGEEELILVFTPWGSAQWCVEDLRIMEPKIEGWTEMDFPEAAYMEQKEDAQGRTVQMLTFEKTEEGIEAAIAAQDAEQQAEVLWRALLEYDGQRFYLVQEERLEPE